MTATQQAGSRALLDIDEGARPRLLDEWQGAPVLWIAPISPASSCSPAQQGRWLKAASRVGRDYLEQVRQVDISRVGERRLDPIWLGAPHL